MVNLSCKGTFKKTFKFLESIRLKNLDKILNKYGEKGVEALREATPKDSGHTADSWYYVVRITNTGFELTFNNSNVVNGVPIAIILQYGHGTRNGGYVEGRDYINPAIRPIFDEIAKKVWKEAVE